MPIYGSNSGFTGMMPPPSHNYDHIRSEDFDDRVSYNSNHQNARQNIPISQNSFRDDVPFESDITSYTDHKDQYRQFEIHTQDLHASPEVQTSKNFLMRKIPRKPLASAAVYPVSETQSLQTDNDTAKQQRPPTSLLKIWWLEALCCLLVVLTVFAMVITVYTYRDQPLPQWKYGIGISSFLAIYGIIFRAAAGFVLSEGLGQLKWTLFRSPRPLHDLHVYDESSRGPLGCIQLLSSFRGAQIAARLGAIATLAMLVLDPFTQQLLGFKNCSVTAKTSHATLPRSSAFYGNATLLWTGYQWPETNMQAAANAGLFAVNATQVKANCGTGNCSYSSTSLFNTVGYCHRCRDVTTQLAITTNTRSSSSNQSVTINSTTITFNQDDYSLSTNSSEQVLMIGGALRQEEFDQLFSQNYSFAFITPSKDSNPVWEDDRGTRAFACNFEMCVRTMNSSISYGTLDEVTVAKYSNWGQPLRHYDTLTRSMIDLSCLNSGQKGFLADAGYKFEDTDVFIPYNGSLLANGTIVPGDFNPKVPADDDEKWLSTIPSTCVYTMSASYSDGMQQFFKELFTGEVPDLAKDSSTRGPAVLNNLYDRGATLDTFNEAMGNMAEAMTSYMRQTTVANFSAPVAGIEYVATACVEPRWQWLAYIVAVAAMVIGFFIAMLLETGVSQGVWRHDFKASAMAMVCAGLDGATRSDLVPALRSGRSVELQVATKNMPVRLDRNQLKFIHQD